MKTKFLSLLLAALMIFGLVFAGCSKQNDNNDGDNVVEKTAEAYLRESFDLLFSAENVSFPLKADGATEITLAVGNPQPLLALLGADTSALPPLSDVSMKVQENAEGTYAICSLNATVAGTPCDITAYGTLEEIVLASGQISGVYGMTMAEFYDMYFELLGIESTFDITALTKYDNKFMEELLTKYSDLLETLFFENAVLEKSESGEDVVINVTLDANAISTIIDTLMRTVINDADIAELLKLSGGEEAVNELKSLEGELDGLKEDITEAESKATAAITVNKATSEFKNATAELFSADETVTVTAENGADAFTFTIEVDEQIITVSFSDGKAVFAASSEDESYEFVFEAKDGVATVTGKADGEDVFAINGTYSVTDTELRYMLTEISASGVSLSLADAKIEFVASTVNAMADMPAATQRIAELDETALQNLLIEFVVNSGLLPYIQ